MTSKTTKIIKGEIRLMANRGFSDSKMNFLTNIKISNAITPLSRGEMTQLETMDVTLPHFTTSIPA